MRTNTHEQKKCFILAQNYKSWIVIINSPGRFSLRLSTNSGPNWMCEWWEWDREKEAKIRKERDRQSSVLCVCSCWYLYVLHFRIIYHTTIPCTTSHRLFRLIFLFLSQFLFVCTFSILFLYRVVFFFGASYLLALKTGQMFCVSYVVVCTCCHLVKIYHPMHGIP